MQSGITSRAGQSRSGHRQKIIQCCGRTSCFKMALKKKPGGTFRQNNQTHDYQWKREPNPTTTYNSGLENEDKNKHELDSQSKEESAKSTSLDSTPVASDSSDEDARSSSADENADDISTAASVQNFEDSSSSPLNVNDHASANATTEPSFDELNSTSLTFDLTEVQSRTAQTLSGDPTNANSALTQQPTTDASASISQANLMNETEPNLLKINSSENISNLTSMSDSSTIKTTTTIITTTAPSTTTSSTMRTKGYTTATTKAAKVNLISIKSVYANIILF
jgi:hypothetical protein